MIIDKKKDIKDYKKLNSTAGQSDKKRRKEKSRPKKSNNKKNTSLYMITYALIIGIIVIFGILYINKYVEMNKLSLRINKVQNEIKTLKAEKQKLKLRISRYKSLDRIEKIAKNDLGMVEPQGVNYIAMNQQNEPNSKDKQLFNPEDKINEFNKLGYKISTWFRGLSQVEAGTLEK